MILITSAYLFGHTFSIAGKLGQCRTVGTACLLLRRIPPNWPVRARTTLKTVGPPLYSESLPMTAVL